jgi:hypothetical protein
VSGRESGELGGGERAAIGESGWVEKAFELGGALLEVDFAKGVVFDFVFSLFDTYDHPPLLLVHDKLLRIDVYWLVSFLSRKAMITNAQGNQR